MNGYQSLTGIFETQDILEVNNLIVAKDAHIGGDLSVKGDLEVEGDLLFPKGAALDYVLKSDADGLATWKPNDLLGDITGLTSATVQHHKWIGKWNPSRQYQRYNRVTHNHVEYRAVLDNVSVPPGETNLLDSYSMYNENYPRPLPTTGFPDMTWHRDISININPKVHGHLTHYRFYKVAENTQTSIRLKVWTPIGAWDFYSSWQILHDHVYPVVEGWNEIELTDPVPLRIGVPNIICYATEGQPFAYDGESPLYTKADPAVVVVTDPSAGIMTWASPANNYAGQRPDQAPSGGAYVFSYLMDFVFKPDVVWEVVLSARPDTVYEDAIQAITNKTNIETISMTVSNNLHLPNIGDLASNVYNLKYLVGIGDENTAKWVSDLAAPQVVAREQFNYLPGAASGKVLTCVDSTGLAEWSDVDVDAVAMAGDVTGMSNNNQVDFVGGGIPVSELLTLSKLPTLLGDVTGHIRENAIWTLGGGTIDVTRLVTDTSLPALLPSLSGDVTGPYSDNAIWTLGGGTIDVTKLLTETSLMAGDVTGPFLDNAIWTLGGGTIDVTKLVTETSLPALLPDLAGDVTGKHDATVVNSLGGGTLPVNQIVTLTTPQVCKNKTFEGLNYFCDLERKKLLNFNLDHVTATCITYLCPTSSATQSIYLPNVPNSSDTLVGKQTTDILTNKTLNHSSNTVAANILRSSSWSASLGGSAPSAGHVLTYNGGAIWADPRTGVSLSGDVTGILNNTVAVKASGDFSVGRIHRLHNGAQIKKVCILDYGVADSVNDHNFQGFGTSNGMMRYHVNDRSNDHVFFAATSTTASNELFRIAGNGIISTTGNMRCRTLLAYAWNPIGAGQGAGGQGAYMGWNRNGGSGRTTFATQQGGGIGGWEWVNYDVNGDQAPAGEPSMQLSREGNLYVRGTIYTNGTPSVFSATWISPVDNFMRMTIPLRSSGSYFNTRTAVTSINISAFSHDGNAILLPTAGTYRVAYRFKLSSATKVQSTVRCNVSIMGTNHPSLFTYDIGVSFMQELNCEAIIPVGADNMWISYPRFDVVENWQITTGQLYDLLTGYYSIQKIN